jgi:hypothetical protein
MPIRNDLCINARYTVDTGYSFTVQYGLQIHALSGNAEKLEFKKLIFFYFVQI